MHRAIVFLLALLLSFPALGDVVIKSGVSSDQVTVEPTAKAIRVTPYDSSGQELFKHADGNYMVPIEVRHTGAAAANTVWFNLRGPPSKTAYIKRIFGNMCFDGTALPASGTMRIGFIRGTGAASPTGGAALAAIQKDSTDVAATITEARIVLAGTALTTTGIVYDANPFYVHGLAAMASQFAPLAAGTAGDSGNCVPFDLKFCETYQPVDDCIAIRTNEHLAIRQQTVAAIIGLTINGMIEWSER